MNINTRILKKITVPDAMSADAAFSKIMGEEVEPRRKFIEEKAPDHVGGIYRWRHRRYEHTFYAVCRAYSLIRTSNIKFFCEPVLTRLANPVVLLL